MRFSICVISLSLIPSAIATSLRDFMQLDQQQMNTQIHIYPALMQNQLIATVVDCQKNFICAYEKTGNVEFLEHIPTDQHAILLRRVADTHRMSRVKDLVSHGFDPQFLDLPIKRTLRLKRRDYADWLREFIPPFQQQLIEDFSERPSVDDKGGTYYDIIDLHKAVGNGSLDIVNQYIADGLDINHVKLISPLMEATMKGRYEIAHALVHAGANINDQSKDLSGRTALMMAVDYNQTEIFSLLIEAGAKLNIRNKHGNTAIMIAARMGRTRMTRELIAAGADLTEVSPDKETSLLIAAENGNLKTLNLLIRSGSSVYAANVRGMTALMLAASKCHGSLVQSLIRSGANVNKQNEDGWTALMLAVDNDCGEVVRTLIQRGANVDQRLKNGMSALIIAAMKGYGDFVGWLVHAGANLEYRYHLLTAQQYASRKGHREIAKFLKAKSGKSPFFCFSC